MYKLLTSILCVVVFAFSIPLNAFATATDRGLYTHVKIGIVGNIAVTDEQISKAKTESGYNFSDIFENSAEMISDMDVAAGFLGMPICQGGAPTELALAMKNAGIDFLSTASKHTLDCDETGMFETIDTLDAAEIKHGGSYKNGTQSAEPIVFTINGIKIGFFSYTTDTLKELPDESVSYVSVLESHHAKVENVSSEEADAWSVLALPQRKYLRQVEDEISAARDDLDYIITLVSCDGTDNEDYKSTWADIMIRAGADFVAFSDGQTVSTMEYKVMRIDANHGRRTAYFHSLGNATADLDVKNTDEGIIFVLTLGTINGYTYVKAAQFIPLYIDEGRMMPIYDYLKYSDIPEEKRIRMREIVQRQTSILMRSEDDKRLRSIYQIKPYVGNSESADEVASYTGRILIIICVVAAFLIVFTMFAFRGKQLFSVIRKSKIT